MLMAEGVPVGSAQLLLASTRGQPLPPPGLRLNQEAALETCAGGIQALGPHGGAERRGSSLCKAKGLSPGPKTGLQLLCTGFPKEQVLSSI